MSIRQGQTIIAKMGMISGSSPYKGEYSDTETFNKGDYVSNGNHFYICLQDNTIGKELGSNEYWKQILETEDLPTKVSELENDSNYISNTATGDYSLTIGGTSTKYIQSTNIGDNSKSLNYSTALGTRAEAMGNASIAIGRKATTSNNNAISLGVSAEANAIGAIALGAQAKNSEAKTFKVALTDANDSVPAVDESTGLYTLLNSDGKIPNERLNLTDYALKSELPTVPTNVSAFTNDVGYLTSHQDISGKADKSDTYTKTEVDAKVSSVYRFKGSVANYDALPTSGLVVGDVYNIESNGSNYAWDGNDWDKLSETIDLTPYLTKTEASTTYATINDVNGEIATLEGSIGNKADKTAIPTKTSQLTNDSGYLTSHQDISGKANTSLNNLTTAGNEYIDSRIIDIMNNQLSIQMDKVYPVGSLYFGEQATCPMASLINGSVWELIDGDRVLQSSSSTHTAGSTIEAGLPNITGSFEYHSWSQNKTGAFYDGSTGIKRRGGDNDSGSKDAKTIFDASRSSSIYGNSTTVQPPAYVVNIWKRTK